MAGEIKLPNLETNIDAFVKHLLHLSDVRNNKLIDLHCKDSETFFLKNDKYPDFYKYVLNVIREKIGQPGSTMMRNSAMVENEQILGANLATVDWMDGEGAREPRQLDLFIKNAYKDIVLKGNNPLFLSVGAIRWRVEVKEFNAVSTKEVLTPVLIFPIRLIRSTKQNPIAIEFIDDDININPCLINKLRESSKFLADKFPHPNEKAEPDMNVNVADLADSENYFARIKEYARENRESDPSGNTVFEFEENVVAISQYNHNDICMYYDIKRHKKEIYEHELVKRIFAISKNPDVYEKPADDEILEQYYILPHDRPQEEIIREVVRGKSLIIKGPPGSGKTVTIANMVAALIAKGKRVLLSSPKTTALAEVYAKLPDKIRRFVMLLECETEAQAARLSPTEVKRDFNRILTARKKYNDLSPAEIADINDVISDRNNANEAIDNYVNLVFTQPILADASYYDALDIYCKYEIPLVYFTSYEDVIKTSRERYNELYQLAQDNGRRFEVLTGNRSHPIKKNPWYPFAGSAMAYSDKHFTVSKETADKIAACKEEFKDKFIACGLDHKNVKMSDALYVCENKFKGETLAALFSEEVKDAHSATIRMRLNRFDAVRNDVITGKIKIAHGEESVEVNKKLGEVTCDLSLTLNEFNTLCGEKEFLDKAKSFGSAEISAFLLVANEILAERTNAEEYYRKAYKVFKESGVKENDEFFKKAISAFSGYTEDEEKVRALDVKGKLTLKKIKEYCILSDATFNEIIKGLKDLEKAGIATKKIIDLRNKVNRIFVCELNDSRFNAAVLLGMKLKDASPLKYLTDLENDEEIIMKAMDRATIKGNPTLADVVKAYEIEVRRYELETEAQEISEMIGYVPENTDYVALARYVAGVYSFAETAGKGREGSEELITDIEKFARIFKKNTEEVKTVINMFIEFGYSCFVNYYAEQGKNVLFGDLDIYVTEASDRKIFGDAINYMKDTRDPNNEPIGSYFSFFENHESEIPALSFELIFEHSFYGIGCKAIAALIKAGERNGLGHKEGDALDVFGEKENKLMELHADLVERECMKQIDPSDPCFRFLNNDREVDGNLRRLFKAGDQPKAILTLKKCFILSPSTASVLFRDDIYSKFDVAIIDEASQLRPTAILPILFRCKQCVMVGDEWQMPPIDHFVATDETNVVREDGETVTLRADFSVLSYALQNKAFESRNLTCHYRSKTEALIKYSQEKYYPFMRTFPANVPKKNGLGFYDIYVEDGFQSGGVNVKEGEIVIKKLKEHFNKYYDAETGVLSRSIGIVAFGEAQIQSILGLVKKDTELSKMISTAISKFKDVPEKLIFFKPIEKVQGQETETLILSMTYGKKEDGTINEASFGQLNRGNLGECIFNVAVTRAKSSVTVIHSIKASDIKTDSSIEYIKRYLEQVELFASDDSRVQFVSNPVDMGFVKQVGEFLEKIGIDSSRIIYDYGVTKGSVRIPIAILSPDLTTAEAGIWCERKRRIDEYLDYEMRYYNILKSRGWNLIRVFAHDWVDNGDAEKRNLTEKINKYITK